MEAILASAQLIKIVLPMITLLVWVLAIHYAYWTFQPQAKQTERTVALPAAVLAIIGLLLFIVSFTIIFGAPPPGFYR